MDGVQGWSHTRHCSDQSGPDRYSVVRRLPSIRLPDTVRDLKICLVSRSGSSCSILVYFRNIQSLTPRRF